MLWSRTTLTPTSELCVAFVSDLGSNVSYSNHLINYDNYTTKWFRQRLDFSLLLERGKDNTNAAMHKAFSNFIRSPKKKRNSSSQSSAGKILLAFSLVGLKWGQSLKIKI